MSTSREHWNLTDDDFAVWPSPTTAAPSRLHEPDADAGMEDCIARMARTAAHCPPTASLLGCSAVAATPQHVEMVQRLADHAAELGLSLPRLIIFRLVDGTSDQPRGLALQLTDETGWQLHLIVLQRSVPTEDWPHLISHELQHVSDLFTGQFGAMTVTERETRACWFALRASETWTP